MTPATPRATVLPPEPAPRLMTGAELLEEVRAYTAEHPDAFEGLEVLIEEAVDDGHLLPPPVVVGRETLRGDVAPLVLLEPVVSAVAGEP